VPGHSFAGEIPPETPDRQALVDRLHADVVAIASEPHNLNHLAALARSEVYIVGQLRAARYEVQTQDVLLPARNIEVVVEPRNASAPTPVIGAHYDSVMEAPGANEVELELL
jgi:hypothetical protein